MLRDLSVQYGTQLARSCWNQALNTLMDVTQKPKLYLQVKEEVRIDKNGGLKTKQTRQSSCLQSISLLCSYIPSEVNRTTVSIKEQS